MAVDTATALKAYGQAVASKPGAAGGAAPLNGDDFASLVTGAVTDAEAKLRTAEQAASQGVTGQASVVDVVTAVSAAELTLETVVAVRDEVVRAYQEILRMPI